MEPKEVLSELGMTTDEVKVYLALLKLGPSPVSRITKETGQHRTTIYDILAQLLEKGMVNTVNQENIKFFKVTDPDYLLDILKRKEEKLNQVLPELKRLAEFSKERLAVEVYKGREGFKIALMDVLKRLKGGGDFYGFGIDEEKFKKIFEREMERYFIQEEKLGIREWLLAQVGTKFIFNKKTTHYRYIPKEYFDPTPTAVYADTVLMIIWEPLACIMIRNEQLAESYKKYHKLLWSIAQETNQLNSSKVDKVKGTIHKGIYSYMALMEDIIATLKKKDEVLIFGVNDEKYLTEDQKHQKKLMEYLQAIDARGITERIIIKKGWKKLEEAKKTSKYKYLPDEYIGNTVFEVYGNKVAILLWGKLSSLVIIENKEIADTYRRQFEFFWKLAKE